MLKPKKTRPKWLVAVGLITVFIITTGVYISMQSGVFGKANDFKIFMTTILFVCLFVAILFAGIKYGLIIGAAAFAIILTTIINANIRWPLIVFVITISVLGPNLYRSLRNYVVRLNIDKPEQINSNMLYLVRNNSAKFDKVFALTEEKDYIRFDYAGGQTHIINQIPTHIRKNHTKSFKLKKSDIDKIVIDTKEKFWQGSLFGQGTVTITINDVSEPFVLHKTNGYKTASRFFADALKSQNSAEIVSVCIDDRIRVIQSEVEFISQQSPKQKQKRKAAEHIALTLNIFGMLSLFMLFWPKMPTALVLLIALIPLGGLGVYIIFSNILTFFETESTSKQGVTFSIICPAITLVSTAIQR